MTDLTPTEAPARRRRHARLIATAVELTAECALAALHGVYGPIADAEPTTGGVPVRLAPLVALAEGAAFRLDAATAEDTRRWPAEAEREEAEGEMTFRRRCATAEADMVLLDAQAPAAAAGPVPLPTPGQLAMMGPDLVAADFVQELDGGSPEDALALVQTAADSGEFTTEQILDAAMNLALTAACLTLRRTATAEDPSMAAEAALMATRSLTTAVMVASMDLVEDTA